MKTGNKENGNLWWMRSVANSGAPIRLLCFPFAGGAASIYRTWHSPMLDIAEVYGIQLPGRANRALEPAFTRVSELVEELGPALEGILDRPFAFFGHSMGAVVCFEVARWLRRHGKPLPCRLFVSSRRAPQVPDTEPFRHLLDDAEFMSSLSELNGMPQEILNDAELIRLTLPTLRADVELVERYEYREEAPFACPITAFAGSRDFEEPVSVMGGWSKQTTGPFTLRVFEGDHFYLQSHEGELLEYLRSDLRRVLMFI